MPHAQKAIISPAAAAPPNNSDLRRIRTELGITITPVAGELGQWVSLISRLERGHTRNDDLATTCRQWLIEQKVA